MDINTDSYADIIIGLGKYFDGDVPVTAINGSNGNSLWDFTTSGTSNHIYAIEIANLDNDSTPEIIAGSGGGSSSNV